MKKDEVRPLCVPFDNVDRVTLQPYTSETGASCPLTFFKAKAWPPQFCINNCVAYSVTDRLVLRF